MRAHTRFYLPISTNGTPIDDRPRIPMTHDWQPGSTFLTDRAAYGFRPDSFSAENLAEFRGFWSAKPDRITQAEWEHRLAVRLKEISNRPPSRASPQRREIPDNNDTSWLDPELARRVGVIQ